MHADLLSAGEAANCQGAGEGYERLVSDHAQQTGERLPERVVEIHALEGAQVVAGGVSYIIQELLHETVDDQNKQGYITQIINTIISTQRADDFIIAMCNLIQRLTIDSLHIVGDIFDRGPGAHIIMDTLCNYHNVDIQWGNHDLLWMGAAAGNDSCIANVIRISMRYGTLTTLEEGYGINLLPLATFAMDTYANDPCTVFALKQKYADKLIRKRRCASLRRCTRR